MIAREQNLVWAAEGNGLVDRRYKQGLTFGDTVHVPSVGNLGAARTKTKASNAAITYETVTETNTDISIATWEYQAMAVESIVKVQGNRDQLKLYAGKMGYSLALAVDDVLAGLVDDVTNTVGTLAVENTDDEWIRARQYLNDANADQKNRAIVISPAAEAGLLKLERFVHADYATLHSDTARDQAYSGTWYRMPVFVSTNVEGSNAAGHDNAMLQQEAFALIMQMNAVAHSQYDIDYLVDKVVIENLYGTKEMRDDHACWVKGA